MVVVVVELEGAGVAGGDIDCSNVQPKLCGRQSNRQALVVCLNRTRGDDPPHMGLVINYREGGLRRGKISLDHPSRFVHAPSP